MWQIGSEGRVCIGSYEDYSPASKVWPVILTFLWYRARKNDRVNPEVPRLQMLRDGTVGEVLLKWRMSSGAPT